MSLGYPMFFNGREVRGPVTISHRPMKGLGHPFRPGFGSTVINPLVAQRPGFGSDLLSKVANGEWVATPNPDQAVEGVIVPNTMDATNVAPLPQCGPNTTPALVLDKNGNVVGATCLAAGKDGKITTSKPTTPGLYPTLYLAAAAALGAGATYFMLRPKGKR